MGGKLTYRVEKRGALNTAVGRTEGTRELRRLRCRWKYDIKINLKKLTESL